MQFHRRFAIRWDRGRAQRIAGCYPRTMIRPLMAVLLASACALPLQANAASLDQVVESFVAPLSAALSAFVFYRLPLFGYEIPWIVLWLAVAASFFTLYMSFINIRGFGLALRLVRGDFHDPTAPGEISHFRAVATAFQQQHGKCHPRNPQYEHRPVQDE